MVVEKLEKLEKAFTMHSKSIKMLMAIGGVIAKVSRSCGMLNKSEVTPRRTLDMEANVSSRSVFEVWLTTYRKQLEEFVEVQSLVDRGVASCFGQNAEPTKEM